MDLTSSLSSQALDPNLFIFAPNSAISSLCSNRRAVHFTGFTGTQSITTQDLTLNANSVMQFELNLGCGLWQTLAAFTVVLEVSTNRGSNWEQLVKICNPLAVGCTLPMLAFPETRYFLRDFVGRYRRFTIPLSITGTARFRWRNERDAGLASSLYVAEWAIAGLYIGDKCTQGCYTHGSCLNSTCVCDAGYTLNKQNGACQLTSTLVSEVREQFEDDLSIALWSPAFGGAPAFGVCGTLASGRSMQFTLNANRMLQTADLNLVHAQFVQFVLQHGHDATISTFPSCFAPSQANAGIVVSYSIDGGVTMRTLRTYSGFIHRRASPISIELPLAARTTAARIIWWQPLHGATSDHWVCFSLLRVVGLIHFIEYRQRVHWTRQASCEPAR
jgi:reelin